MKTIDVYSVELSKPVDEPFYQLSLEEYTEITNITNRYNITFKQDILNGLWLLKIKFKTCKDIFYLMQRFKDYDISVKNVKRRIIK